MAPITEVNTLDSSTSGLAQVQWFSIINSVVIILLLLVFLATILLRVLKNDFVRFTADTELGEEAEESGWKYVHGDVFRFPSNTNLFAAMLGVGTQMLALTSSLFVLALLNFFLPHHRGTMLATGALLYALTAGVAGYTSGESGGVGRGWPEVASSRATPVAVG